MSVLTLFAFSTDNRRRPNHEVKGLMELLTKYLDSHVVDELADLDIRFRVIGETVRLSPEILRRIRSAERKSSPGKAMMVNLAISYGGRESIVEAALKLHYEIERGSINATEVNEKVFSSLLDTANQPDPDLVIRTGGRIRISNFLLWECAYSELYFTDALWPDFDEKELMKAVVCFRQRVRSFGMLPQQLHPIGSPPEGNE